MPKLGEWNKYGKECECGHTHKHFGKVTVRCLTVWKSGTVLAFCRCNKFIVGKRYEFICDSDLAEVKRSRRKRSN